MTENKYVGRSLLHKTWRWAPEHAGGATDGVRTDSSNKYSRAAAASEAA